MSDSFSAEVSGLDRIISGLQAATEETTGQIERLFAGAADRVYTNSQALVPVLSGDLKGSGKPEAWKDGNSFGWDVSYGDGSATPHTYSYNATETGGAVDADGYSWFVELGTAKMGAQPYLGPPFEEESQGLVHELGNTFS